MNVASVSRPQHRRRPRPGIPPPRPTMWDITRGQMWDITRGQVLNAYLFHALTLHIG